MICSLEKTLFSFLAFILEEQYKHLQETTWLDTFCYAKHSQRTGLEATFLLLDANRV
jgi:hypothetical protein